MEKRVAHYNLNEIQSIVAQAGIRVFTATARQGLENMGLTAAQGVEVILSLTRRQLYKSMTTIADRHLWQDVYHATCQNGKQAYIKLTRREGALVIQFKEK